MNVLVLPSDESALLVKATFPHTHPVDLYDYWVRAELITEWWVERVAQLEAVEGGKYQFEWPKIDSTLRGTFQQVVPGLHLRFTWTWDHLPELPLRMVNINFIPTYDERGTYLRIRHGNYDNSDRDQSDRQNHLDGWLYFLERLQEVCGAA